MWNSLGSALDTGVYSLTQTVFDGIDTLGVRLFRANYVELGIKTERQVFDNQDILNSYTVIDKFSASLDSRELRLSTEFFTQNLSIGFTFGVGGSLNFTNIRQVNANRYTTLPSVEDEYAQLNDTIENVETYGSGYYIDPSLRPRVNRLWNLVTFPFKLPLTLRRLDKLEDGELMSYGVSGYVEVGPEFGVALAPDNGIADLGVRLNYVTFLSGEFRITVLKENGRHVRVKLTKLQEKGRRLNVTGEGRDVNIFKGFLLFKGTDRERRILDIDVQLVPFEFSVEKKKIKSLDIGYRYDLADPKAREAFKKALYGSFSLSEDLQGKQNADGIKPIEKLFTKRSEGIGRRSAYEMNLSVYRRRHSSDATSIEAVLELPTGEHKVFKESRSLNKEWRAIWGSFEKVNYNYTISLDKTAFSQGKPNSLQMVVEANINDSHTSGKEMRKYVHEVRTALGNPDLLPDLPVRVPRRNGKSKIARYKRSTFYYGFNLNQKQLIKFIKTKPRKMWKLLEKAFHIKSGKWSTRLARAKYRALHIGSSIANVPLAIISSHMKKGNNLEVAKKIYSRWSRLSRSFDKNLIENVDKKIELLSRMFKSKHFGHEALRLILLSLEQEKLDYFLVASNDSFGRISERGRVTTNSEYLLNLTDENIGFERIAGGLRSDPNILIKDLKTKVIGDKVHVSFNLDHESKLLYFKLYKSNRLSRAQSKSEFVFKNKTRFKKGLNKLVIDRESLDSIGLRLSESLYEKNYYSLTMSSTLDGRSWSKVASSRFYFSNSID
jgi:hypothetical protein